MRAPRVLAAVMAAVLCIGGGAIRAGASAPTTYSGPVAIDRDYYQGSASRVYRDPAIAVDPGDQSHLVATGLAGANGDCAAAFSHDAGHSWAPASVLVPSGLTTCAGRDAGPMQPVFAGSSVIVLAQTASADRSTEELVALGSTDGGQSFSPYGVVAKADVSSGQVADQASLVADTATPGRLVAAYGCGSRHTGGQANQLCLSASADSGKTWGPLGSLVCQFCSPASDPDTYVSWPRLTITGAGTMVVAWRGVNPIIDAGNPSTPPLSLGLPSPPSGTNEPTPGDPSCGSFCRLYTLSFAKGATATTKATVVAPVADDALAAPAVVSDPRNDRAYLLWHSTGVDGNGTPIEAVWLMRSDDGGSTWYARSFRDAVLPAVLGDASGDVVFPSASVAPNGRLDVVFVHMARAAQAPKTYCYQYAQGSPAANASCPTDVSYGYMDPTADSLNLAGVVTPRPYDSLAGLAAGRQAAGVLGAAVASSNDGAHPTWTAAQGDSRDTLTDCFSYNGSLCLPPPPPAPIAPVAVVPSSAATTPTSTLTLIYDHRFHLVGDLYTHLPDAAPLPPRVIIRVVAPDRPPLALVSAVLAISLLILAAAALTGVRRGRTWLRRRRAVSAPSEQ